MTVQNELITILMPVYNRESYVSKAIDSILNQTYSHWQLFILNDGSSDKTEEVIKPYLKDKRIHYYSFDKNQGVGKTLIFGVKQVNTDLFFVVDSDDWLNENAVELLYNEIQKDDEISLVYGHSKLWLDNGNTSEEIGEMKHKSFDDKYDFILYPSTPSPRMFRTKYVRQVNSFETDDPNQGRFGEDRYLLYKLIAISKFSCVDEFIYNIRIHDNNTVKKDNRKFFNETKKYVIDKLLKEWGDEYEPIYELLDSGWLNISKLRKK